jgi:YVTN family beta-propeller protein
MVATARSRRSLSSGWDLAYCRTWVMNLRISGLLMMAVAAGGLLESPQSLAQNGYITNFSSNTVSVIDTVTGPAIAVGSLPVGVAVTPDGSKIYVASSGSITVSVIDRADKAVSGSTRSRRMK